MNDLMSVVDWSRAQFALTAMYHWLFVPLTLGLSVIVAVMETAYVRTGSEKWLTITKFWMKLFGINFALGVATGIILEFEFGTNWSNYSWFVGDIFGAPLAIEGLLAFFMESTFIAVMFFGWKKVSKGFHLAATWLTAIGASLSAAWILIANAWMQLPVGMEFDPAQMRNVMDDFWALVFSPVAMHKFAHAVMNGWTLGGVFVIAVSCWFMLRRRHVDEALLSIKTGGWIGLIGIVCTVWSGHGSAVDVARWQPMKLAAMEGLWNGGANHELVAVGILKPGVDGKAEVADPFAFKIAFPGMLSWLATGTTQGYVPGIADVIAGKTLSASGTPVQTPSYDERILLGLDAHEALRLYDAARAAGDDDAMAEAQALMAPGYPYFGYGYLSTPLEAIPPVAMTFYSFHIMVIAGGYLMAFFVIFLLLAYCRPGWYGSRWTQWIGMLTIVVVYVCSEAGWVTAEVGRQPWIIQDLMPTRAAISYISTAMVQLTFWLFAAIFTGLLAAEICILLKAIKRGPEPAKESSAAEA